LGSIAIVALFTFIGGEVVRLLWNWLLPPLFGWRQVTFWQALGLLALCRILFGRFGFHGGSRSNSRIRERLADRMADRVAERWAHMTRRNVGVSGNACASVAASTQAPGKARRRGRAWSDDAGQPRVSFNMGPLGQRPSASRNRNAAMAAGRNQGVPL
jgi:hypothetical protein